MISELTERQKELKERFTKDRGYWDEGTWGSILRLDEGYFETYLNLSAHPWKQGVLEPKVKELIYIAIDASCTHLYGPGIRQHISNALKYGATVKEIMEVFELTSVLGIHTLTVGVPILLEEMEKTVKEDI